MNKEIFNTINGVLGDSTAILIIFILAILIAYIGLGILLSKLNKKIYDKSTPMAWLPLFNIYLLGKLAFNKIFSFVIFLALFATGEYKFTINDSSTTIRFLPGELDALVSAIVGFLLIISLVIVIVKLIKYRNEIGPIQENGIFDFIKSKKNKPENIQVVNSSESKFISNSTEASNIDFMSVDKTENIEEPELSEFEIKKEEQLVEANSQVEIDSIPEKEEPIQVINESTNPIDETQEDDYEEIVKKKTLKEMLEVEEPIQIIESKTKEVVKPVLVSELDSEREIRIETLDTKHEEPSVDDIPVATGMSLEIQEISDANEEENVEVQTQKLDVPEMEPVSKEE